MSQKFFLTTPLYYVNAEPHIGSAYTTIAADSICRFWKLYGFDVCLLTGVDEHGGKIEATALGRGVSPQEHCDEITQKFQELWAKLNINYQKFSRTSSQKHNKLVQAFFERVKANGDIYQAQYKGLYCLACEDFKNERELLEGKLCQIHHTPVQEYAENNYFFKLSKYSDRLVGFFKENPEFIGPKFRLHEINTWIEEGLKDFPISRRSVKWGVPIPGDDEQTIYVWFDALLGYLSPFYYESDDNYFDVLPAYWPASVHLIGKDILRFHAVYWVAMLMSAQLPLPKRLFGHGFLTKDGEKMGKTRGNILVPNELIERFGIDAVRFYFLFNIPFGQDGDYTDQSFIETVNAYLANRLGNLFSRVLKLVENNLNGQVPTGYKLDQNSEIAKLSLALPEKLKTQIENFELHAGLVSVFEVVDKLNLNLTEVKPWNLFKQDKQEAKNKAIVCLIETLESLRIVANLLEPFIPSLAEKMLAIYGLTKANTWEELQKWNYLQPGQKLQNPGPLFSRIE
jgi:methionyl-tRNA synthetase